MGSELPDLLAYLHGMTCRHENDRDYGQTLRAVCSTVSPDTSGQLTTDQDQIGRLITPQGQRRRPIALATTAGAAGVDERTIMEQTGHKTTTMVRRYIRRGALFRNNAAAKVGL